MKEKKKKLKSLYEDEPSFPDPNKDQEWEGLKMKRPFNHPIGQGMGVDYHKDKDYNKTFGGFIGKRLQDGFDILKDSDE
jgi:hypothetical protein